MSHPATSAVVLARGLGTRMRASDGATTLSAAQAAAADRGLKALVPDARGRPFLDHILDGLASAGITDVVLVAAPDHRALTDHLRHHPPSRVSTRIVIQQEPLGTADAVLAARAAVGDAPFLVCNADNLYPPGALRHLVTADGPALVGFSREGLFRDGLIDPARVAAFALLETDGEGMLQRLVEKPDPEEVARWTADALVSMNLWRFDAGIFAACAAVVPSPRGELELPLAVADAVAAGARVRVIRSDEPVLDLSRRSDVGTVATVLAGREITP